MLGMEIGSWIFFAILISKLLIANLTLRFIEIDSWNFDTILINKLSIANLTLRFIEIDSWILKAVLISKLLTADLALRSIKIGSWNFWCYINQYIVDSRLSPKIHTYRFLKSINRKSNQNHIKLYQFHKTPQ